MTNVSVIIITCDRPQMLGDCVRDSLMQEGVSEVIVVDDSLGQSGKAALPKDDLRIRYVPTMGRIGPAAARNLAATHAKGDILVHFDDDCRVLSPATVQHAIVDLEPPEVAAVAMPYRNIYLGERVSCRARDPEAIETTFAFTACAYAIKKAPFHEVGGYREELFYMGEESDLCLRLRDRGYVIRRGRGPVVNHLQPAGRVSWAADFYGRRNDILIEVFNAPVSSIPPALARAMVKTLIYGFKVKRPWVMMRGTLAGLLGAVRMHRKRSSVSKVAYSSFKQAVLAGED